MGPVAERLPVAVLGGTGYVAGELLRLLAGHPELELAVVSSSSQAGEPVDSVFPNLAGGYGGMKFEASEALARRCERGGVAGLFCTAPHGAAAGALATILQRSGNGLRVVDSSADFRFRTAEAYRAVYGSDHGAPERLAEFTCAVPEHHPEAPAGHVAHPGCFATAVLLAVMPLLSSGVGEAEFYVTGITGSTGSGRSPGAGTHHPERHSNVYAYKPLAHRHAPEMESLAEAVTGRATRVHFVPHSGPYARGIHVTVQGRLAGSRGTDVVEALYSGYRGSPFIEVVAQPPRVKDVVGSNRARLSAAANEESYAVTCVLDNLVKGAAGGALQWMNRLLDLPETAGLTLPGPAWT